MLTIFPSLFKITNLIKKTAFYIPMTLVSRVIMVIMPLILLNNIKIINRSIVIKRWNTGAYVIYIIIINKLKIILSLNC